MHMQRSFVIFTEAKYDICMNLTIKAHAYTHMCAIHPKWQHHIYSRPTFYYAKLMIYREPCVN